jgi:transposase
MQLKAILNRLQKQPGFVYAKVSWVRRPLGRRELRIDIRPRKGSRPVCSGCGRRCRCYDRLLERHFQFVPLWGLPVFFAYAPRRADCSRCGVTVEMLPWAVGKSPVTITFAWFLASWAKVLSWKETAMRFGTSWHVVLTAVRHAVQWGREHLDLDGISAIGVDELAWKKGHRYLTLVYQLDHGCRRLLWIGRDRTAASFNRFFDWLGEARTANLKFVASDMWRAFLSVVARRAGAAVHVLDRFHVAQLFSKAIDEVRREEARRLREKGDRVTLKHARWPLLKRSQNLTEGQQGRLTELLLRANLKTVRAYLLKEHFQWFWSYQSAYWAGRFLDRWTAAAVRSRIEPVARFARTLRAHRAHLLNWFRARGTIALGAVEGMNAKARVTTKIAYGFRTYEHAEIALYHRLGNLPEPTWFTHRFV